MIINTYSIYDAAAKAYMRPMFMQTDGLAMRVFKDAINSEEQSDISKHPEQFTLFKIGEFDDQKGVINSTDKPELLASGHEVKEHYETAELVDLTDPQVIKAGGTN